MAVAIAWKPPSTCRISPLMPRDQSENRKQTACATATGRSVSQPSGARSGPLAGQAVEARDAARGRRLDRAGGDEVHADARGAEVAGQVAGHGLERRPWRRPSSRTRARPREASKSSPTTLPPSSIRGSSSAASALSENALVVKACGGALGRGLEEAAAERVLGREGDRVEHAVDAAPAARRARRAARAGPPGCSRRARARQRARAAAGRALGQPPGAAEAREHHLGARQLRLLGHREGDAAVGQGPGDQQALAVEVHSSTGTAAQGVVLGRRSLSRRTTASTTARSTSRPCWLRHAPLVSSMPRRPGAVAQAGPRRGSCRRLPPGA